MYSVTTAGNSEWLDRYLFHRSRLQTIIYGVKTAGYREWVGRYLFHRIRL